MVSEACSKMTYVKSSFYFDNYLLAIILQNISPLQEEIREKKIRIFKT